MTPLDDLGERVGREFPTLHSARDTTERRLSERSTILTELEQDEDVGVVLVGSWGRGEVTSGSDDDFMILVHGPERENVSPSIPDVTDALARETGGYQPPGREGTFGKNVFSANLIENIGLSDDSNENLTQRMLLLLESRGLLMHEVRDVVRRELIERYLAERPKDFRPPRFLLNDVIRYWRTIAVDFAAKARRRSNESWGLKNAKLRTSRRMLFASGLLPILRCHELPSAEMADFLLTQYESSPVDRLSEAFLHYHDLEGGSRVMDAYDRFLSMLDSEAIRTELASIVDPTAAHSSKSFSTVASLGGEIEDGLLGLFYGPALGSWTKQYGLL